MGSELSLDGQKIYDKLVELLKGGKKLDISIDEIKKKAGTPNIANATVSGIIFREKKKGTRFFKNISLKRFAGGLEVGVSKHDATYNNSKKFRNFYKQNYDTPWNKIDNSDRTNPKASAYNAFLRHKSAPTDFTLTTDEVAKKLGITKTSLRTYETTPDVNTSSRFIRDNIKKQRTIDTTGKLAGTVVRYKDPGKNILKNWNVLQESSMISQKMVDNIKEYDKLFRDQLKSTKELPEISEVIERTSMKTPSTIANTEALYSRLLRGENFRRDVGIARDVVLGKKIIDELSEDTRYNKRRSAFYRLALDNVNKMYPGQSGNLETFKTNFRNELKAILGLKGKKAQVPFSINEVISLSAGETRGVQPFSVFVDAVESNINKGELSTYQSDFSKKLDKVQKLLSGKNPNTVEAARIAGLLKGDRKVLVDALTQKGFTTNQINQLNIPDIKVSKIIDPKHYTAEQLARWKKQTKGALDIEQFVKDKGYYIDIKKAKPFWESNVNNTVIEAAKHNVGNICGIFKGKIAYSAEGGRIGFQGGCGREMTIAMQTDSKGTLQQITKTEGIIPKFKNVAQGFLGTLGKFGPAAGKFGALAAVGAAAPAAVEMVRQFVNDDPSTYLTDENQMKGMLLSTLESQERQKPRSEILDWGIGAGTVGATAAAVPGTSALWRARRLPTLKRAGMGMPRAALGPAMKLISGMYTPAGILAAEPLRIAQRRREGEDWGEIATSPHLWMGPAFASGMTGIATSGMKKGSLLAKALRLGISPAALKTISRRFGMPGLALSLGLSGYETYQDYKKKRGWFAKD